MNIIIAKWPRCFSVLARPFWSGAHHLVFLVHDVHVLHADVRQLPVITRIKLAVPVIHLGEEIIPRLSHGSYGMVYRDFHWNRSSPVLISVLMQGSASLVSVLNLPWVNLYEEVI